MRTHHWLTAFLTGIVIVAGRWKAEAQFPQNVEGRAAYSPVSAQQFQPGFNPYPAISPYDHVFEETYNQDGLWGSRSSNDNQNHFYSGIEFLSARFSGFADDKVGTEVPTGAMYFDTGLQSINNGVPPLGRTFFNSAAASLFGGAGPYPAANSGLLSGPQSASGLRLHLGVDTPTGMSYEVDGMAIFPQSHTRSWGRPIVRFGPQDGSADVIEYQLPDGIYDPDLRGFSPGPGGLRTDVIDLDGVGAFNPGIPIIDGSTLGAVVRTDAYLRLEQESELYGAGVTLFQTTSTKIFGFDVRPLYGARFVNTKELFGVIGHDSGIDYEINLGPGPDDDGIREGGIPLDGFEFPEDLIRAPYRVYIDSSTQTNMGGPELGWRYSAGGDSFSLTGESRIGVMVAREKSKLTTQGLGQAYFINDDDPDAGPPPTFGGFNPFYDPFASTIATDEATFITPTFQQSFNTSSHLLQYIPVVRNFGVFREANFTAGWTIFAIAQLQRPNQSIVYQSGNGIDPANNTVQQNFEGDSTLVPQLKSDRSLFYTNYWNIGVEWQY